MIDPNPTDEPPPPPPPRPDRPAWWRSPDNRYLAGVAGGLGERYGVDPLFIRVGLVIATLVTADDGSSVMPFLYALAWVLLPVGRRPSIVARFNHDVDARREAAAAAALVVSAWVLLPRLGPGGSADLRVGVVLLGLAVLLLVSRGGRGSATEGSSPAGPGGMADGPTSAAGAGHHGRGGPDDGPTASAGAGYYGRGAPADDGPTASAGAESYGSSGLDDAPTASAEGGSYGRGGPDDGPTASAGAGPWSERSPSFGRWSAAPGVGRRWTPPPWTPPAPPRLHRSDRPGRRGPALWPLTVALLVIYGIACAAIDTLREDGLRPGLAVSGALLTVGGVLVLSAWRGRARGTIVIALALLPLWVAFVPGNVERFEGTGELVLTPGRAADAESVELGYGRMQLDLSKVELRPGEVLRTRVALTGGIARVTVPSDTELLVQGQVGMGTIRIEGDGDFQQEEELAVNRDVSWSFAPQPRRCVEQEVPVTGLSFNDGSFSSAADLTAELERREWEPPSPPHLDETTGEEVVTVAVDDQYFLCDASQPDVPPNPATVVLDLDLGLADLEVSRVPTH